MNKNNNTISEKESIIKKLYQMPLELSEKINEVSLDSDIAELGFQCKGMLCDYEGYEDFYERLWVWAKVDKDRIYTVVTVDFGNTHCNVDYRDLYVNEIINEINMKVSANRKLSTKRIHQIPQELDEKFNNVSLESDLKTVGFERKEMLCSYEGYEKFDKNLSLWVMVEDNMIYTFITGDGENNSCKEVYRDLYVKEIIDEINSDITA